MLIRPDRAHGGGCLRFVLWVGIGICEEDRDGGAPLIGKPLRCHAYGVQINLCADTAIGQRAFGYFQAMSSINDGLKITAQPPSAGTIPAAHFQHIAQALGGDHTDLGTLAF